MFSDKLVSVFYIILVSNTIVKCPFHKQLNCLIQTLTHYIYFCLNRNFQLVDICVILVGTTLNIVGT